MVNRKNDSIRETIDTRAVIFRRGRENNNDDCKESKHVMYMILAEPM